MTIGTGAGGFFGARGPRARREAGTSSEDSATCGFCEESEERHEQEVFTDAGLTER